MNGIELIKNIHNIISIWDKYFIIIYLFLLVADTALLIVAKKYKPSIKYYRIHEKYGLVKLTFFKIIFIYVDMYILSSHPSTGAFTAGIQLWYATFIVLFFKEIFFKKDNKIERKGI